MLSRVYWQLVADVVLCLGLKLGRKEMPTNVDEKARCQKVPMKNGT
jgi:hypothetical protein